MKKPLAFLTAFLLITFVVLLWGCQGSDGPGDPAPDPCSLTISSPAAGSEFLPGDVDHQTVSIRWTRTGGADSVSIDLLKGGTLVGPVIPATANDGFYSWTARNLGAANGSDFALKVTALGESACTDTSALFTLTNTIGCSLAFTNTFGDTLIAGAMLPLTWDSQSTTGLVDIRLIKQDGSFEGFVAEGLVDDGDFDWNIDSLHQGTYDHYFLKISDSSVTGCEGVSNSFRMEDDDVCSIGLINPSAGVVWEEGDTETIMFSASVEVSRLDLRLYMGNVFLGTIVSDLDASSSQYQWQVWDFGNDPPSADNRYRIRAINSDDQYCVGKSGLFTIHSH